MPWAVTIRQSRAPTWHQQKEVKVTPKGKPASPKPKPPRGTFSTLPGGAQTLRATSNVLGSASLPVPLTSGLAGAPVSPQGSGPTHILARTGFQAVYWSNARRCSICLISRLAGSRSFRDSVHLHRPKALSCPWGSEATKNVSRLREG